MVNNWRVLLFLSVIGILTFYNGLRGEFVHDDLLVLSHSFFSQPGKLFLFFTQPYFEDFLQSGLYRPVTQIILGLNFLVGRSPLGFHLVNILLHIFNSFLVYLILKKIIAQNPLSLIAALFFLVLPIHVEAVTSIVGRAELLAFLFAISALLLWLNSRYFLSAITLLFALLSKESAIAIVPIVFLFSLRYRFNPTSIYEWWRRAWLWLVYYAAVVLFYFGLRIIVLGKYAFKAQVEFIFNPLAHSSFLERILTALKILVLYIQKVFVPIGLSADYSYDQIPIVKNLFSSPLPWAGAAIVGLIILVIYRIWFVSAANSRISRDKAAERPAAILEWRWALIFFFFPYLVISNLIFPIGTIMADRLMYFPSLGAVMVLSWANQRLLRFSKWFGWSIFLTLLAFYGLLVVKQNNIWASRETLLGNIFKKSPHSVVAKTEYGVLMLNKDPQLVRRLTREVYEKYPDYVQNLNLYAAVEVQDGRLVEAEKFLERARDLRPEHQNTLYNLSRVYFTLGKYSQAEDALRILALKYGGRGNVIFYALVQAENGKVAESRQTIYSFFGPQVKDESALKILKGEFKELDNFYIFGK